MNRFRVIDCDGHVVESDAELAEYAEHNGKSLRRAPGVGGLPLFPSLDGWFRVISDKLSSGDPESWYRYLEATGIELTVLHPSAGLAYGLNQDPQWGIGLARAYNNWLNDRYLRADKRFKGLALVPLHRPDEGAKELRRAVTELGMLGAILPAVTSLAKPYGDPHFYPIFEEAQRLGCVLTFHGAPSRGLGLDHFDTFIKVHTLSHPVSIMIQFTSMMFDGVYERFPEVRVAFLEAGIGWVPYLMDRMDEEYETRGKRMAPSLTKLPSEYVRDGHIYFAAEAEEKTLPYAVTLVGEDKIMWASDFPHERDHEQFIENFGALAERTDISDRVKQKIFFDNANRFYRLETPAAS